MGSFERASLMDLLRYVSSNSISLLTVAQPLSFDEEVEDTLQQISDAKALYNSQVPHMDPAWHAKFRDSATQLFRFVKDNLHDETCRMLPKTNECDRRNQPLPENIIGRHFGTFTRREN